MADSPTCSSPGCSHPGTHKCGTCKTSPYCGPICQTAHWPTHKEECQGRLIKLGLAHLLKALGFEERRNWMQSLRFSESALTMLIKLNARSIEIIETLDDAMRIKYNALNFTGQHKEALVSAQERYSMWAAGYMRHYGMLRAAFPLIESLLQNEEYEQAALIARTAHEMIINDRDNIIPEDKRQGFFADGSFLLAQALYRLSETGGIPPEQKQKAGEEAITLLRKALEIRNEIYGVESEEVAVTMGALASVLQYFNGVDDCDEIFRLYEQTIAFYCRVQGNISSNKAALEYNLALVYQRRANVHESNDMDQCLADLELSLTHLREAERIYRLHNRISNIDECVRNIESIEQRLIQIRLARI